MAGRSVLLNQKWAADAHSARCAAGLRRDFGEYVEVGEMWKTQTRNAAIFPTKGMIANTCLRWRKLDGSVVAWDCGREGDTLIAPKWALKA